MSQVRALLRPPSFPHSPEPAFWKESTVRNRMIARAAVTAVVFAAFGLGYVVGSVSERRADAQGVGGVLEQAGKLGGPLGAVGQLGSSIVEMEQHVSGLQKNLDVLRKVQSALTGK